MFVEKSEKKWVLLIDEKDNQLGLINIIRFLDGVNNEINTNPVENLQLEIDLSQLQSANSELIAQFVILQTNLVRHNGRLSIINANPMLKSTFDVVMLDKIISIMYTGNVQSDSYEYDDDDDSE
jgi:anti-anti-sigma regulatory factor